MNANFLDKAGRNLVSGNAPRINSRKSAKFAARIMNYEKIVLVTRKTRLEGLIARFNTQAQARFYIEHSGGDFGLYEREHATYQASLAALKRDLQGLTKMQVIERGFLPNFVFAESDLVVTIGIDGLVVNTAKYLDGQPLVAVNPDPEHVDGILLPFTVESAPEAVKNVMSNKFAVKAITMAEARLNDGQSLLAFNDFFIGVRSHISARYLIRAEGREEHHSSSGVLVCTGAGSTGWMSSVFNMARGLMKTYAGGDEALCCPALSWDTDHLLFAVREPFVSKTSSAGIVCGTITRESPLVLKSEMPEGGVIFSDGVEADYLAFNSGAVATIGVAARKTRLVVG
jgi:NAD kinase